MSRFVVTGWDDFAGLDAWPGDEIRFARSGNVYRIGRDGEPVMTYDGSLSKAIQETQVAMVLPTIKLSTEIA